MIKNTFRSLFVAAILVLIQNQSFAGDCTPGVIFNQTPTNANNYLCYRSGFGGMKLYDAPTPTCPTSVLQAVASSELWMAQYQCGIPQYGGTFQTHVFFCTEYVMCNYTGYGGGGSGGSGGSTGNACDQCHAGLGPNDPWSLCDEVCNP